MLCYTQFVSVAKALIKFTKHITTVFDSGNKLIRVFLDLSKVFFILSPSSIIIKT